MWMHVCVNVFRNMHWLIFHFSYFMHFLNLLLTLPECSAQVLQREFMGLNLEQSVWFNRYLLNKTHDGGGPPSVQPSHSGRNGCVSWECLWRSQWWPQHWSVVLLSPLAWPWPEEQTHTQWHRKPDLDSLHHLCLEMSLSLTRLFLTDTSLLYSSVQGVWSGPDHCVFTRLRASVQLWQEN